MKASEIAQLEKEKKEDISVIVYYFEFQYFLLEKNVFLQTHKCLCV